MKGLRITPSTADNLSISIDCDNGRSGTNLMGVSLANDDGADTFYAWCHASAGACRQAGS